MPDRPVDGKRRRRSQQGNPSRGGFRGTRGLARGFCARSARGPCAGWGDGLAGQGGCWEGGRGKAETNRGLRPCGRHPGNGVLTRSRGTERGHRQVPRQELPPRRAWRVLYRTTRSWFRGRHLRWLQRAHQRRLLRAGDCFGEGVNGRRGGHERGATTEGGPGPRGGHPGERAGRHRLADRTGIRAGDDDPRVQARVLPRLSALLGSRFSVRRRQPDLHEIRCDRN